MNEKLWNKNYILVLLLNTLSAFSFYMIATILSKYLVGIGATMTMAGFIVGLFSITSLFCRPFTGILADRFSNVNILKVSNIFMCVGLIGFVITTDLNLLILFRIINGIGFALSGTSQIALGSKYIPKDRMGEGIGYLGLGMVVGSAAAPGIGLAIEESLGMKITFLIAAALIFISFIILFFFEKDVKKESAKKKLNINDIIAFKALPFTFVAGTFSFANGIIASYLVLFAEELNVGSISLYFTIYAVVLFFVRPLSGKLMDKYGIRVTVIPGLILTAASMFLLGQSTTLIMIFITGIIRSLGQGSAQPSLQAGCINLVGVEKSGSATSTYYLGGDICQGFGPMIGGVIVGEIGGIAGYTAIFSLCGILQLIAVVYFIFYTRKKKQAVS